MYRGIIYRSTADLAQDCGGFPLPCYVASDGGASWPLFDRRTALSLCAALNDFAGQRWRYYGERDEFVLEDESGERLEWSAGVSTTYGRLFSIEPDTGAYSVRPLEAVPALATLDAGESLLPCYWLEELRCYAFSHAQAEALAAKQELLIAEYDDGKPQQFGRLTFEEWAGAWAWVESYFDGPSTLYYALDTDAGPLYPIGGDWGLEPAQL